MKNNASLVYGFFLIVGDFLALVAAFVSAYILRVKLDERPLVAQVAAREYLIAFLYVLPIWLLIFALLGLYSKNTYENRFSEFGRLLVGCFLGILTMIGYEYVSNASIFPARLVPVYGLGLAFAFLLLFRTIARGTRRSLFGYGIGVSNVLIVGDSSITAEFVDSLSNTKVTGCRVIGVVADKEIHGKFPHFKSFEEAVEKLGKRRINSIVQTELYTAEKNSQIQSFAQENHISYRFVPNHSELFSGNIDVELLYSIPVVAVHQTALVGWGRIVKRLFDIFAGSIALLIASPFMLIIAIIIKLSDGGPVFLRQVRLTRFNREFRVFKFRSHNQTYNGLTPDEAFEKMGRPDLLKKFRDNGNYIENDPRETAIGRFIRKTSLDELPQLFNVITGDLSLVGPRALIPKDLAAYKKRHTILSVKSGITGLAQVSGRNNIPPDQRRALDIYYVQNWSFWLDLTIIARTFRAVITHEKESPK